MLEEDRKQFVQLLLMSELFPHEVKQLIMVAFLNKDMEEQDVEALLDVLREERQAVHLLEDEFNARVTQLQSKYRITE